MRTVAEKWDPANPNCAFKHYFYNKVDESTIPFYKPQPGENAREWEEALERKPAPGFMPVLCPGFQALSDRLMTQGRAVGEFSARLHQVNASLDALLARHELQTDVRAAAAQRRHAALGARVLALAGRVQVLRNRGYALGGDEDELQERLNALGRDVHDPAVGAREEELWSRLIGLKAWGEQLAKDMEKPSRGDVGEIDDEVEGRAKKVSVRRRAGGGGYLFRRVLTDIAESQVLEEYEMQIQHLKREMDGLLKAYGDWERHQSESNGKA
jgi:nuclear pore complex protein Nup54